MTRVVARSLSVLCVFSVALGVLSAANPIAAQETPAATQKRAKSRGRLPRFYSTVVDEQQREQIYVVQQKYAPQLKKLQDEIDALVAQRKAEVEKLLTPEQLQQIDKLAAEAEALREAERLRRAAEEQPAATPGQPAASAPAATPATVPATRPARAAQPPAADPSN